MKPFHTIATPHKDILEGRLTMDVFAADLWETYMNRAPSEYRDAELFFRKTYMTGGLKNLLDVVGKRLRDGGGDPVIEIQTPFGGGKTHAMIALYHSAKQWGVTPVVIVGTPLNPKEETPWGLIEKQLTGSNKTLIGNISPGRDALRKLLEEHQPSLILMDEILEYTTKASGVPVGDSTLASQVLAFLQELTEAASELERTCVVITLPSSELEHYDEKAEKLFSQLQKVSGRIEKIYTPVQDNEISKVVRARLFSSVNQAKAKSVVYDFINYAEKEGILPMGVDASDYSKRFIDSYPFIPEVLEVLYHRWGSLPNFQRTRGILRLLSLVIYSLKERDRPYLTLADFDLSNSDLRRELLRSISQEFDSIIAADITASDYGSKKVDISTGSSYRGLSIGTRAATTIFLYSFSGGKENGALISEIKRNATITGVPSSIVTEAVEKLKESLFYLQYQDGKFYFLNQPNLNRVILTKMENIEDNEVKERERDLLRSQISGKKFKVLLWPEKPRDVPDTSDLKLVIIQRKDEKFMQGVLESKGDTPRIYRNTIFFLCPYEIEKNTLISSIKKEIAYKQVQADKTLKLTEEQKREVSQNIKTIEGSFKDVVKRGYRLVFVPIKDGLKEIDLGIPTYGELKELDDWVYDGLNSVQEVLEKIAPIVIKQKYLGDRDFVGVRLIYESMLKTQGEKRLVSPDALKESISQGVKQGLFGLGILLDQKGETLECKYFEEDALSTMDENEVIVAVTFCKKQRASFVGTTTELPQLVEEEASESSSSFERSSKNRNNVSLKFTVPLGKVSQVMGMMNFLQNKFKILKITINATEGSISDEEYESKIKETLRQLGLEDNQE
ncbi:MAG: hypothetical protein M0Z77_07395 [Thermoplasmatales archaeon]|nr:hypothetical protein [Thermoplasmatales archaeon]